LSVLGKEATITRVTGAHQVVPTETGILAARAQAMEAFRVLDLNEHQLFAIELSLQEALVNALVHGVSESLASHIWLSYERDPQRLRITVEDDGIDHDHRVGVSTGTGLGLPLVNALMSCVTITAGGHRICMELDCPLSVGQVLTEAYR
jgi:anti-sigma regulatory factor (Ser/Thr protein kinase)